MISRRARIETGQAAVETALLVPFLLILLLGIFEFGRAWNVKQVVTDANREAARQAVVQDPLITQDSVRGVIRGALDRSGIPDTAATITFDTLPPPGGHWRETGAMQTIYLGVEYEFRFFGPIFKAVYGTETITVAAQVSMRNE